MGTKNSIKDNFQYFNINDYKTCIYSKMQQCYQGFIKHSFLSKRYEQNIFPPVRVRQKLFITTQFNITAYEFYFSCKYPHCCYKKKNKQDLLCYLHVTSLDLLI